MLAAQPSSNGISRYNRGILARYCSAADTQCCRYSRAARSTILMRYRRADVTLACEDASETGEAGSGVVVWCGAVLHSIDPPDHVTGAGLQLAERRPGQSQAPPVRSPGLFNIQSPPHFPVRAAAGETSLFRLSSSYNYFVMLEHVGGVVVQLCLSSAGGGRAAAAGRGGQY